MKELLSSWGGGLGTPGDAWDIHIIFSPIENDVFFHGKFSAILQEAASSASGSETAEVATTPAAPPWGKPQGGRSDKGGSPEKNGRKYAPPS